MYSHQDALDEYASSAELRPTCGLNYPYPLGAIPIEAYEAL